MRILYLRGYLLGLGLLLTTHLRAQPPCLADWSYRVPVAVDNSSGPALTDYQVLVELNTSTLVGAGKAKIDGGDIRWLDAAGQVLPFWIEENTYNTTATRIWVKVPSLPANSTPEIYLFYGNNVALSESEGDDTFLWFDNFEEATLNATKWEVCGATSPTIGNGNVVFNSSSSTAALRAKTAIGTPTITEMHVAGVNDGLAFIGQQSGTDQGYALVHDIDGGTFMRLMRLSGGNCPQLEEESTVNSEQANATQGTWSFAWPATGQQQLDWPGNSAATPISRTDNTYALPTATHVTLGNRADATGNTGTLEVSWVYARQYTITEPTTSLGSEEVLLTSVSAGNGGPYCAGETI